MRAEDKAYDFAEDCICEAVTPEQAVKWLLAGWEEALRTRRNADMKQFSRMLDKAPI